MQPKYHLITRFASKLFGEFLPAAIASAIGAVLLSQYTRPATPPPPPPVAADPANAELMQMVRDEHARIVVLLEKNGETRQPSDVVAEKDRPRSRIVERLVTQPSPRAKSAEQKVAALAGTETNNSPKKPSAVQQPPKQEGNIVVREPLQLNAENAQVRSASSPIKVAAPAPRKDDNFLLTKWRETTGAIEKVPTWVRSMVERLSDDIGSVSLPRAPHFQML